MLQRVLTVGLVSLGFARMAAWADVKLPAIIGNNMVVQAGKTVPVWGTADAGEKVTVTLAGQTQAVSADVDGKWMVKFAPVNPGDLGEMTVAGRTTQVVQNVLAGTVWVCSGQSNMQFPLSGAHNAAMELPKAQYPKMRLFTVANAIAFKPKTDCGGRWVECMPETAKGFSAVAYFFGRELHEASGQPVGLIHASWGGTPAQAWTSLDGLDKDATLKDAYGDPFRKTMEMMPQLKEEYVRKTLPKYEEQFREWQEDAKKAKAEGRDSAPAPFKPGAPDQGPGTSMLYNAMIAPLIPYAIEGVTWYQGEANAGKAVLYRTLFPRLISDWREKWGQGDFHFFFVQAPNYGKRTTVPTDTSGGWGWPLLREAQSLTLKLPNTGMAVAIDIGEEHDLHPKNKMDVGHRLALWAEKKVLGKDVVCSGPLYSGMQVEGSKVRLRFTEIGGGLVIGVAPAIRAEVTPARPLSELKGFAIAGEDHRWVWADARIDGNTIIVWSDKVAGPVAVRYAWALNPECNLYNRAGLPASPFRTDNWTR